MCKAIKVSDSADALARRLRASGVQYIGLDTETDEISDTCPVPPLVCLTLFAPPDLNKIYDWKQAGAVAEALFKVCLRDDIVIVGHHLPFDIAVLVIEYPHLAPLVREMLDRGLFECTLLCEKLNDIARGNYDNEHKAIWHEGQLFYYSLAERYKYRTGKHVEKGDDKTWRNRFGHFRRLNLPVELWPKDAVDYALLDPYLAWHMRVIQDADEQSDPAGEGYYCYANAAAQTRAGFALMLQRWRGIRTDPVHTQRFKKELAQRSEAVQGTLIDMGLVRAGYMMPKAQRWKPPSTIEKAVQSAIVRAARAAGVSIKLTGKPPEWISPDKIALEQPPGSKAGKWTVMPGEAGLPLEKVCMDREQLELLNDPKLIKMVEFKKCQKLLGYTTVLEHGFNHPIHSEPNTLVANGRISWGSDSPDGADRPGSVNLTNLPSDPGVRECYVPHGFDYDAYIKKLHDHNAAYHGNVFFSVDYSTLELCTLAQACIWLLGKSKLAEYLNAGVDLHSMLGSMILNITYDEFLARRKKGETLIKYVRELAKRANFGLGGGMGYDRFLSTCRDLIVELREVGIVLTRELVVHLKKLWLAMYPEMQEYFDIASHVAEGPQQIVQLVSQRLRGGLIYTETANGFFSALAADGVKAASWALTRAMYFDPESPLYHNAWLTTQPHDEFVGETPLELSHITVPEIECIARDTMQEWVPDIKIKCSKAISFRWRKDAEETRNDEGQLIPYELGAKFQELLAKGEAYA